MVSLGRLARVKSVVEEYALAMANSMYKTMQGQKNQGEKFTWQAFPDLCGVLAKHGWWNVTTCEDEFTEDQNDQLDELAYKVAEKEAKRLVQGSGVM